MARINASVDKEIFEKMVSSIKRKNNDLRIKDEENKRKIIDLENLKNELLDKCKYLENLNAAYKSQIEELNNNVASNEAESALEKIKNNKNLNYVFDNKMHDKKKYHEIFAELLSKEVITHSDIRWYLSEQEKYKNNIFNFNENQVIQIFKKKVESCDIVLKMMDVKARNSKSLAELLSLQKINQGLKYFSESVREDMKICMSFVERDVSNFQYVNLDTENYFDLFFHVFERNPKVLIYLKDDIKNNPDKFMFGDEDQSRKISYERKINLKIFPYLLLCLGDRVIEEYSLAEKVLIEHGEIIKYLPDSYRHDERYILAALKSYPEFILSVDEGLRGERRFLLEALKQNQKIKDIIPVDISEDEIKKESNFKFTSSFLTKILNK